MNEKPVIGFVGLGFMGHGMAKNIIKSGYRLWIKGNVNRAPIENLLSMGALEAASPREMAEKCDIIHLCLPGSLQVEEILKGQDGILSGAHTGLIVIDTSTSDPTSTASLAEMMAKKGVKLLDAPLGRTPREAEEGTLDVMLGGSASDLEVVAPVIECWAKSITHIGPVGSGHKMKLLMNFLGASYAALYSESISLAVKVGISPQAFREVIGPSRLGSGFFDTFMKYVCERDQDAHRFTIANMSKDIRYVNSMATDAGVVNLMAAAARHYFTHAEAIDGGGDFVPMLSDHVGRLNGLNIGSSVKGPAD